MIFNRDDARMPGNTAPLIHTGIDEDYRLFKGDYIGIVRARESQYEFLVRDTRGEGPTIHGGGADFPHVASKVTEILNALTCEL